LTILVHIVDDDAQVRAATAYLLESHGFETVSHVGGSALLSDPRLDQGCILLDIRMPGMTGHQVQEELARRGVSSPVVVMSAHGDLPAAISAMKLGAADFIQKPPSEDELVAAIRRADEAFRKGADRRAGTLAAQARLQPLSRRERQILQGLVGGLSNKAIARQLDLSPRTVEMHRANMMAELGVATLSEALRIALDAELAALDGEGGSAAPPAPIAAPVPVSGDAALGETLQQILEASGEGMFDWDITAGKVSLSPSRAELLGLSDRAAREPIEQLQGRVHPDDMSRFRQAVDAHLEGRTESYWCEYRMRMADGGWRWQEARGRVVERDAASGAARRMVGTIRDVTERKQETEQGREALELLELARQGAGAGVWDIDLATDKVHLCPRSRELHGLASDGPSEISLDGWKELVDPQDLPVTLAAIDRAVTTGEPCSAEYRIAASGGRQRWVLALGKVIRDQGLPVRLIGLSQDISDRKAAARASNRVQSELIHLSGLSAMGTMASTLTHELSQPLTAMVHFTRGMTRRLAEIGVLEDSNLRDALAGAERSAMLASEIVSRLGSQVARPEPQRQPSSLSALVRETCALALIDADANGIRHSLALDPAADPISVDPVQVQQLLLNLLRNASDALMEVPVPQRRLRVATRRIAADEVAVEVADTGLGIPGAVRDSLFEPFVTSKAEGTGIGLSVSRTIVEAHGGQIMAEDKPDGGALFRFTLKA
jgi:PAS domain S-box-containing protein